MTLDAPNTLNPLPRTLLRLRQQRPDAVGEQVAERALHSGGAWPHAIRRVSCAKNAGRCRRNASASSAASARSVATCGSGCRVLRYLHSRCHLVHRRPP